MIDINNPDHEAALRWACEIKADIDAGKVVTLVGGSRSGKKLKLEAIDTISSPASAVDLIRQLVERGGTQKHIVSTPIGIALYPPSPLPREEEEFWFAAHELPALIARLLAIAPGAGPTEVSKALKGAT